MTPVAPLADPKEQESLERRMLERRQEFPILERSTYLINHSLGAMPRGVRDSLEEYARMWDERGIRSWAEGWWDMPVTVGNLLAKIMDAEPGSVVMHQNVSVCQAMIASCFDFSGPRNKIVYTALNFPTVMYVWEEHRRVGARIVEVPSHDGMTIETQDLVDAIDEETLLVPISHVLFKSGFLQDVEAVVEKAHSVGAMVILDCYQSTGTVPFSLRDLKVDFAVGGSVKWLNGGPGAGYLYVRPDLRGQLRPRVTGWMAHKAPFAFEPGVIDFAEDGTRFLHGSPNVPGMFAARPGYELVLEVGVENIRRKSIRQTQFLLEQARARGFEVTSPEDPQRRGGTVTVQVPEAAAVVKALARREILIDQRPGAGLRISPHYYSTDEEIVAGLDAVKEILDDGSWKDAAGGGAGY